MPKLSSLLTREDLRAVAWPAGACVLALGLSYGATRWTGSLGASAVAWAWGAALALVLSEAVEARRRASPQDAANTRRAALLVASAPLWLALLGAASTVVNGLWDLIAGPALVNPDRALWMLVLAAILGVAGAVLSQLLGPPAAPSGASPVGPLAAGAVASAVAALGAGVAHFQQAPRWEPLLAIVAWAVALPWIWRMAWRRFDAALSEPAET
ncbi:MAG: hypothetical protein AAGA57_10750 [Planctomycetota bacterium]